MDFRDLKEYFQNYVQGYKPYNDSGVYNVFISFLVDKYFNDSYTIIPEDFKTAFERQLMPVKFVVPFLESIGITNDIISKLSVSDQYAVATLMSDFHRYKGTVTLLDKLMISFSDKQALTIYELYLTRNTSGVWKVLPVALKKSSLAMTEKVVELPFSTLDSAEHWYIDEVTLDNMWNDGEISLPYKTNCLKLSGAVHEDISLIVQLAGSLALETFKADQIQLFFKDSNYATTVDKFNLLWHYIIHYTYSKGSVVSPFTNHTIMDGSLIFGQYEVPTKTATLPRGKINIQSILDEYYNYKSHTNTDTITTDIWTFFKNKVEIFTGPITSSSTSFGVYRSNTISSLGLSLVDYIDNRLSSATILKEETNLLLGELYSSMLTFKLVSTTNLDTSYLDYYLLSLPGYSKDMSTSPFFLMFSFLKPNHCDIITDVISNTSSNSLFDNGLAAYTTAMSYFCTFTTFESIADNASTNQHMLPMYSNQLALSVPAGHSYISSTSDTFGINGSSSGPYTYFNPNTGTTTVFLT